MSGTASVFALGLFAASVATSWGDDIYSGLTCTVSGHGQIDTVCLCVPKAEGPCKLVSISPTVISSLNAPIWVSRISVTNFASSPAKPLPPGTVLPSSTEAMEFAGLALKELGTLTTTPGTAYTDCRLLTFQKDAVIVTWTGGIVKIILADLDVASRQRVESVRGK